MKLQSFNIRVYGIYINEQNEILVSDEIQNGKRFTKFPGGGMELGEGTKDCLIREWKEELNQDIEVTEHIYTTDYFQVSAFNPVHQIVSIYYRVFPLNELFVRIAEKPFDFPDEKEGAESFRRIAMSELKIEDFTFPIDQIVAKILLINPNSINSHTAQIK
jgi:8-oxo-dGTP diphosphatase